MPSKWPLRSRVVTGKLGLGFVYKTSFDKANRTSASSARGLGLEKALAIFADLREQLGISILTDVHEPGQCALVAEAVDVLQIPAFLCRQTDLLIAAAKTGRAINVKRASSLPPGTWPTWRPRLPALVIPTCS
jgi:2-dehydro-3-deoxyphosphooctonate aldolase (KDO 8-P synthase)